MIIWDQADLYNIIARDLQSSIAETLFMEIADLFTHFETWQKPS